MPSDDRRDAVLRTQVLQDDNSDVRLLKMHVHRHRAATYLTHA